MAIFSVRSDDPNDLSMDQAIEIAQKDYARLLHQHDVSWEIDLTGSVRWTCHCSPTTHRDTPAIESHVKESIRRERGPTRGPNKPK